MMTVFIFRDNTRTSSNKDLGLTHVPPARSATAPRKGMEEARFQTAHTSLWPLKPRAVAWPGTGSPAEVGPHPGLGCAELESEFA